MNQLDIFSFFSGVLAEQFMPVNSNDWKWTMSNDYPIEKNGLKVFSCFSCGGGSTMGYKLAGCEVIGCCEIDKKMNDVYVKNHHPKYNYLMDIRKFNEIPNEELPEELFKLDILDGSPPCSPFSMVGCRSKTWGKKKKFREGQVEQVLDDLLFKFIDTVAKLKPKVVIMENVESILFGEAFAYVRRIYKRFSDIGYSVKHYILKGECMGVPQKRHRVFFIATRLDFDFDNLNMFFNYLPVVYSDIASGEHMESTTKMGKLAKLSILGERSLADTMERIYGCRSCFSERIIYKDDVCKTLTAGCDHLWIENTGTCLNDLEMISAQTFPRDFDFMGENVKYVCGMSVPPVMIKRIVTRLVESGIFNLS